MKPEERKKLMKVDRMILGLITFGIIYLVVTVVLVGTGIWATIKLVEWLVN